MKSILAKLHAIMAEVNYIQKDKRNDFHKYEYASEQAIKETLHPLLVKHRVLFAFDVTDIIVSGSMTTAKMKYRFYDVDNGEVLEGVFAGQGQDQGDKGIWKAVTGAIKYTLTSTFLIPTGTDPEADSSTDEPCKMKAEPAKPTVVAPRVPYLATEGVTECDSCHSKNIKLIPSGVSKKTGKSYGAFYSCEACKFTMQA